jgi:hypothetical protein
MDPNEDPGLDFRLAMRPAAWFARLRQPYAMPMLGG